MSTFAAFTLGAWSLSVALAFFVRNRLFATFVAVILGIHSLVAVGLATQIGPLFPAFAALHVTVYVNFAMLARPRMRPLVYRLLVSWPAAFFSAGTMLGMPLAIAVAFGARPGLGVLVPYGLALVGLAQSMSSRRDEVDLVVGEGVSRVDVPLPLPHPRGTEREARPLRLAQITDPHIGPFMSVERLRAIAQRAVDENPDLVLLTGDFLTMESHSDPDLLLRALEPLQKLPGRVFACHGNHDHEAPAVVRRAMERNGIALLVDERRVVETEAGPVDLLGLDFVWRDKVEHMARICRENPRIEGALRLVLLHDPGAFKHLPEGEGDLVLSGHTHGGQVGLVSLGLSWTFLRLFGPKIPDHGMWARGRDRLYVHRGTGHYGFPLRLGVPAEEGVIRVHRRSRAT